MNRQQDLPQDARQAQAIPTIFAAGLTCGVLDISAAFITWGARGVTPFRLLQGIATGLLGAKSFQGGWKTAALGGACHFLIAFSAAAIFYAASRKLMFMVQRPFLSGVLYGCAVYIVMNWIVKPLSRVARQPVSASMEGIALLTLIVCIGLPISLIVHRYSPLPPSQRLRGISR